MIPGHPIGAWTFVGEWVKIPIPTPAELGEIFDELDTSGKLSHDSWLALRRLGFHMEGQPMKYGCFVEKPEPEEFEWDWIADDISEDRVAEIEAGSTPTADEVRLFQSRYMERSHADGEPGMSAANGWSVRDDRNRERLLVTLHGDRGCFESVAGLFLSADLAECALRGHGDFEWIW